MGGQLLTVVGINGQFGSLLLILACMIRSGLVADHFVNGALAVSIRYRLLMRYWL